MKVRRQYHFHASGLVFIAVTVLLGLGAINSQNNLLFLAFGLALGSILVTGSITGATLMRVVAERTPPPTARVGEPVHFVYRARNRSRWLPAFGLVIEEHGRRAGLGRVRTGIRHIPARQSRYTRVRVTPRQRGLIPLGAVRVWTIFPLGVLKKSATFTQPGCVLVRPALAPIAPSVLEQAFSSAGRTDTVSQRIGRDAEFHGLRPYIVGDPLRRIAWRASARTEDLVVRENYATMSGDITIALSLSGVERSDSDDLPERDEQAISVAASLAELAVARGARVTLLVPAVALRVESGAGAEHGACEPIHDALARLDLDAISGVRARRPIPATSAALVVVHAHEIDPSLAPPGAIHLTPARALGDVHAAEPRGRAA